MSAGGVVRVTPGVTRHLLSRTGEHHVWLATCAPPVGAVADFGADVVREE